MHTAPQTAAAVTTRLPEVVYTTTTACPDFEGPEQSHRRINQRRATSGCQSWLEKRPHGVGGSLHTAPESAAAVITRLPKVACATTTARPDFGGPGQSHRRNNQRRATSGCQSLLEKRPHGVCGSLHTAPESAAAVLTRLPKVSCTTTTARPDFGGPGQSHRRINQRRATSGCQ